MRKPYLSGQLNICITSSLKYNGFNDSKNIRIKNICSLWLTLNPRLLYNLKKTNFTTHHFLRKVSLLTSVPPSPLLITLECIPHRHVSLDMTLNKLTFFHANLQIRGLIVCRHFPSLPIVFGLFLDLLRGVERHFPRIAECD